MLSISALARSSGLSAMWSLLSAEGYHHFFAVHGDGEAAGQTLPHLHLHLIPRYAGDSEDPRGGVRWIFPQKAKYWP